MVFCFDDDLSDDDEDSDWMIFDFSPQFEKYIDEERLVPKQLFCCSHSLSLICHCILDKSGSFVHVLPLIKSFHSLVVATQKLQELCGKKLLKVAKTRWHYFYYVCDRLLEIKDSVKSVANDRDIPIPFKWSDVEACVNLIRPIAKATMFLEGDKYVTASSVVPTLLSIQEHLADCGRECSELALISKELQSEFQKRFDIIINPENVAFDQTYLVMSVKSGKCERA